jgi:hypothetical protein
MNKRTVLAYRDLQRVKKVQMLLLQNAVKEKMLEKSKGS